MQIRWNTWCWLGCWVAAWAACCLGRRAHRMCARGVCEGSRKHTGAKTAQHTPCECGHSIPNLTSHLSASGKLQLGLLLTSSRLGTCLAVRTRRHSLSMS